ncbi:hypothetical protein ACOMHN_043645 [Nucella lapillus]
MRGRHQVLKDYTVCVCSRYRGKTDSSLGHTILTTKMKISVSCQGKVDYPPSPSAVKEMQIPDGPSIQQFQVPLPPGQVKRRNTTRIFLGHISAPDAFTGS